MKPRASDSNLESRDSARAAVIPAFRVALLSSPVVWSRVESCCSNLKYVFNNSSMPSGATRLEMTSALGPTSGFWRTNTQFTRVQALSVSLHVLVLALLMLPLLPMLPPYSLSPRHSHTSLLAPAGLLSLYARELTPGLDQAHGGGGGGEHNQLSASVGQPPIFLHLQITPPAVKPPENPKMPAPPSLLGPPELHLDYPEFNKWGDPNSSSNNDSSGPGGGGGIGTGHNGGIGDSEGGGFGSGEAGGMGNGPNGQGTPGYGFPTCLYCPNAQYSGEAIKAKVAGRILLAVVITAAGRATNIRVVRGLGFGLDENAVEAVGHWRFRPALGPDHRPAAVTAPIEVIFHIY